MKTKLFRFLALSVVAVACACSAKADVSLIGNKQMSGQTLDGDGAKAVLLGKKVTLAGNRVVIVIVKNSPAQDKFLQSTVGMNTAQLQNHWRRLFMTGGGTAPKIVENEAEALKVAAETVGAVAMVDGANVGDLPILFSAKTP